MLRRIPFEKIENFRDVGGYAAAYGETSFGVVYRSGSLSDATKKDLDTLAAVGIKTVIDLRDDRSKSKKSLTKRPRIPALKRSICRSMAMAACRHPART
jgi:protein-tyrosine phosphatase